MIDDQVVDWHMQSKII